MFLQSIRDEGKGRAMGVGTETPVTAEFCEGFGVAKVLIHYHFIWGEPKILSFRHYRWVEV